MRFQVTVRYGTERQRYHVLTIEAPEIGSALESAAARLPEEVAREGTLVEVRPAVEPEARRYAGTGEGDEPAGGTGRA